MFLVARQSLSFLGASLTGVPAGAIALARAAHRAISDGIVWGAGLTVAALAALTAVVCVAGCTLTPANGAISLAWAVRAANGLAVTCDSVGGRFVALRIRNRGSGAFTATAFPCADGHGTAQLMPGLYDVSFQLDAADGTRLATAPDQTGVSLVSGRLTQLAPVSLMVRGSSLSTLVLSLATGATTNCRPASAGGAGITGNTITLAVVGGGCAPVTLTRRLGDQVVGTYTVSCSAPSVAACIEKDETLTTSIDPGSYLLHARGKIGVNDCWQLDDTFDVAAGTTVLRTLGLLPTHGPGC